VPRSDPSRLFARRKTGPVTSMETSESFRPRHMTFNAILRVVSFIYMLFRVRVVIGLSSVHRGDVPAIFRRTNVFVVHIPNTSFNWEKLAPTYPTQLSKSNIIGWLHSPVIRKGSHGGLLGVDQRVEFTDPFDGAQLLVEQLNEMGYSLSINEREYFTQVFTLFKTNASSSSLILNEGSMQRSCKFKARLVSSRGPIGKKCPRWHVDNTPIRLVLALAGPGCMYIPIHHEQTMKSVNKNGKRSPRILVNRNALNNLDEEDSEKANKIILPYGEEDVAIQAHTGDAVFMMGRALEDEIDGRDCCLHSSESLVKALVHKSPNIAADEARVLLTLDIVRPLID
jgi:hypothetical protein